MNDSTTQQQSPITNFGDVWLEVMKDMEARRQFGIAKYGTPVQPNNGRKALVDLYQELLDAAVYVKQELMEREEERR